MNAFLNPCTVRCLASPVADSFCTQRRPRSYSSHDFSPHCSVLFGTQRLRSSNFLLQNGFPTARRPRSSTVEYSYTSPESPTTMLFEQLAEKMNETVRKLQGTDKISERNIVKALKDIRKSLLDADVNLHVVNKLMKEIKAKAIGTEVFAGVNPGQMFVKVMHEELTKIMGADQTPLASRKPGEGPTVVILAGLQGSGKTTAAAKLALFLKKQKKSVLLVACDVYRPAAIEQLKTLGAKVEVDVFTRGTDLKPQDIAREGVEAAKKDGIDVVILDTAGRQVIDSTLMKELKDIKSVSNADETLLVVDAMIGQEAANLARAFNDDIGITGAILSKLDGDTRGGAALSVQQVSGKPIKFIGVGEKVGKLEPFYPDRMASRILGMGDVLTFVEKAQESMDRVKAEKMTRKMMEAKFDFQDFLEQTRMVASMGSFGGIVKMLPGVGKINNEKLAAAEKKLKLAESMIRSMTPKERQHPELLFSDPTSRSRLNRIAKGSGRTYAQARELISDFQKMRTMMQRMSNQMLDPKTLQPSNTGGMNRAQRRRSAKKKIERSPVKKGFGK